MTRELSFGIGLPPTGPLNEVLHTATEVEELGFDFLWLNDDRLGRDPFALLAAIAQRTERIRLGPGVTNPYSRHAALIATSMATLDELSGGRAVLGLGAGGTNHSALGIRRTAPTKALREAVEVIRGLLTGAHVTVEGRVVTAHDASLDFEPHRDRLPIYIGARGPRVLQLAGEIADGTIVGNVATEEGWSYAKRQLDRGAARAGGRRLEELELVAWLYGCVCNDESAALEAIRPMVATSLATSRPILDALGIDMPSAFAREMEAREWSMSWEVVAEASAHVPDEIVRCFGLAGNPAECRDRLAKLLRKFPEISQVVLVPFAPAEGSVDGTIRRFMSEVAGGLVAATRV
ncbi:MAG: LLM class flavin-dependent oxidoreductase [Solirubrobacterales bacterium]